MLDDIWCIDIKTLSDDELWEHFGKMLKQHDWYYAMSDDHRIWTRGTVQKAHITECSDILGKLDIGRRDSLLKKYNPTDKR